MKVAILYLLTGVGHFREALAIQQALENKGIKTILVDGYKKLKTSKSLFAKIVGNLYSFLTTKAILRLMVVTTSLISKKSSENRLVNVLTRFLININSQIAKSIGFFFKKSFNLEKYDYIISTHPMTSLMTIGAGKRSKIINVIPDEVENIPLNFYMINGVINTVNSQSVKTASQKLSLDQKNIIITGHPLDPKIFDSRGEIFERVQEDLSKERVILGLFMGLFGPKSQKDGLISIINELSEPLKENIIMAKILTGGHQDFEERLEKTIIDLGLKDKVIITYTKTPDEIVNIGHKWIFDEINIICSRPSELTFYSLSTGIPHIILPPVGPQEVNMLNLLQKHADIKEYRQLKGNLLNYLQNKEVLLKTSKDLFRSSYNFSGAENIASIIKN